MKRSLVVFGTKQESLAALAADLELEVAPIAGELDAAAPAGDLALVSIERDVDAGFKVASTLARAGTRVVVQGAAKDADLILRAMRSGAQEYVIAGDAEGLRRALGVRNAVAVELRGQVTAVFGAKGGLGATTLATNLAGALAKGGRRACIVDLDPALGGVASVLDLTPAYTVGHVVLNMHRLDRELIDASVPRHASGVWVIAPGQEFESADTLDGATATRLIAFLRRHYDAVVLDGLRGFDEHAIAALDASDHVLLVATQEVTAIRNAQRCLGLFKRLGYPDGKVQLLVNRFQKSATISTPVVEETLEVPVAATVANDFAGLARAVAAGALLVQGAPRAQITRDIEALAPLAGIEGAAGDRPRSIFGRIFSKGAA